ncbi:MAG: TlyA family RNA methyltransferase [Syntrophobacteria bacterium]|jgi:23S rRNA (cytidine1920-2'-O)/16S rRNA (cytidine1409-2'-O)-methyltransferase
MAGRSRLDVLLVERGLAESRQRAVALIIAGKVQVDGYQASKAGQRVAADAKVELLDQDETYVSRGGFKLASALDSFSMEVAHLVVMDVGASTGGFTDCLLQRGAKKVYAIDVGYGQLAWQLRQDPRVVTVERCNVRYLTSKQVPELVDLAVIDTSFISLTKVIPKVLEFVKGGGQLLALIKPQFEVGRGQVGKGGVVRDLELHRQVVRKIEQFCQGQGMEVRGVKESSLLGPKGNREFFIFAVKFER